MLSLLEDAFSGLSDLISGLEDLFSALVDPHTYVRIFFIILGISLVLCALTYGN
jgi:hypothetical protein